MSDLDDVISWYRAMLDAHGAWMPDLEGKRALLAERDRWAADAAGPKAKKMTAPLSYQWDQAVYLLARGSKHLAPGWSEDWDDLIPHLYQP